MFSWCESIAENITQIPVVLLDGVKDIFIPDPEELESMWQDTVSKISDKFGFVKYDMSSLFAQSKEFEDLESNYTIYGVGTLNLKFFDKTYLNQGIAFFRPYIRGFIALLIVLFHIRSAQNFFGYNLGDVENAKSSIKKGE